MTFLTNFSAGLNYSVSFTPALVVVRLVIFTFFLAAFSGTSCIGAENPMGPIDNFNVVWTSPSKDSSGSMPLGNGDIGLNVWVEKNGDLLFYISKSDAWSESVRLLKLGRIRISLTPNPFKEGFPFRQTLNLRGGEIEVIAGGGPSETRIAVWADANSPRIVVEAEGKPEFEVAAALEVWRTAPRQLGKKESFSAYGLSEGPDPVIVQPDVVVESTDDEVVWYHRNESSAWPLTMKLQGLWGWAEQQRDPLLGRTFGGLMRGTGFARSGPGSLKSVRPAERHLLNITCLTAQTPTAEDWIKEIKAQKSMGKDDLPEARRSHREWWAAFWDRSWIIVTGTDPRCAVVSRGYALQRYISACAGRGTFPIKFNGSLFTVDAEIDGKPVDADYRQWGGPYWFQNTRLAYWPMLACGDFEMMIPLYRMFLDSLPMAKERTRLYFGHEGAFCPETMYFWGAYANDNYGWNRAGKHCSHVDNTYIRWHWSGALEMIAIMLDHYEYTGDDDLARTYLIPIADSTIEFFDLHYERDAQGKILFKPAQALETWQNVVNPLPEIAGLRYLLPKLLNLPANLTSEGQRARWRRMMDEIPDLPMREADGQKILAPAAELLGPIANSENPELYAIFPFRLYGVGKPDLETARRTYLERGVKGNNGWRQDDAQAAYLGMAKTAADYVGERFANKHAGSRFPAFWGPNFDWIPDQDHGCNGLITMQTMLLQADDGKLILFPAWPKGWDVDFKLTAPRKTTVEGTLRNGKLERIVVMPNEREKDIIVMPAQ